MLSECQRRAEERRPGALRRRQGQGGSGACGPSHGGRPELRRGAGCEGQQGGPEETGALRSTAGGCEQRAAGGGS